MSPTKDPGERALEKLRQAKQTHDEADEQFDRQSTDWVAAARSAGVKWETIGEALGMNRPNVMRKYGPRLEITTEVRVRDWDAD